MAGFLQMTRLWPIINPMKTPLKITGIALSVVIMGIAFIPRTSQSQQTQPAPVQAQIQAVEQYKVFDLSKYSNLPQLESDLNKMGADGWKVRTSTPTFLILSKAG
jgi:hypothetical protein